ncbi:pentatricopeptide repeat-containing protein [Tanacetum coccineum]
MNNKPEMFRISSSDAAIQLDLISRVNGISGAEDYFNNLPNNLMDKRIYEALLNAYVRARMVEKAESLLVEMKKKDYASHVLPFNVMMTLYMNLKDQEKVEALVLEMMQSNIDLDLYSYNIWISSRGSQGSIEKMEEAFERLIFDESVNPNWTTHSTMATFYIKNSRFDKAEDCLRKIETLITCRDRIPFHHLLSHYGSIGKKEEVGTLETGSHETFLKEMLNVGKSNSSTWEIVAEGHIKESRISEALSCLEKALANEGSSFWRPKPMNISVLYNLCERENDEKSKEALLEVLRKVGVLEDDLYMSFLPFYKGSKAENVQVSVGDDDE